jgi:hypothetical protein
MKTLELIELEINGAYGNTVADTIDGTAVCFVKRAKHANGRPYGSKIVAYIDGVDEPMEFGLAKDAIKFFTRHAGSYAKAC